MLNDKTRNKTVSPQERCPIKRGFTAYGLSTCRGNLCNYINPLTVNQQLVVPDNIQYCDYQLSGKGEGFQSVYNCCSLLLIKYTCIRILHCLLDS